MAPLARWNVGSAVNSIAVSRDGARVVSGSDDGQVRVWDVRTGAIVIGPLKGHAGSIYSIAISHDGARIISSSYDRTIRVWDTQTGDSIGTPLKGHTDMIWSVAFSPDSTHIISGSSDETIRIWDGKTGGPIGEPIKGHTGVVFSVAFSPSGNQIISCSGDGTIRIWDAHTRALLGEPLEGHTWKVYKAIFSSDGTRIISASHDGTIRISNADNRTAIGELREDSAILSMALSPDEARIVSGSQDRSIHIWDLRSRALIGAPLKGHTERVYSVAFLPDNARVISCSGDGTICIWAALWNSPSSEMVSSEMSVPEMFESLVKHGCTDLTFSIDPGNFSSSPIATGGFGEVWQAWMQNGVLVAVKCLRLHMIIENDQKGRKRTMRELHYWSKVRHENVQELLGIILFQGRLGMVSLWMENGNLQQYIEKHPNTDRYQLCVQVAKGVSYLHSIGMVHGDIKALNILVSADGILKISDFDYSILTGSTLRFSETTRPGGGTFRWMAPELLLDRDDDDSPPAARNKTTDVYALGMTMLEIISGNVPYQEFQSEFSIYRALDKKQFPKRPQELPESDARATKMWALLVQCWDHDPDARPDATSVLNQLEGFAI